MYSNQIAQICANSICSLDFIRSVCFLFIPTWPRHYGSSSQSLNDLQRFVELVKILRLLTCGGTSSPALGAKPRRAIHFLCFKVVQPERLKQLVTTSGNWIWWILIRKPWCNDAFDSHLAVVRSRSCITWQIAGMPRKTIRIEAAHLLPGMELEKDMESSNQGKFCCLCEASRPAFVNPESTGHANINKHLESRIDSCKHPRSVCKIDMNLQLLKRKKWNSGRSRSWKIKGEKVWGEYLKHCFHFQKSRIYLGSGLLGFDLSVFRSIFRVKKRPRHLLDPWLRTCLVWRAVAGLTRQLGCGGPPGGSLPRSELVAIFTSTFTSKLQKRQDFAETVPGGDR